MILIDHAWFSFELLLNMILLIINSPLIHEHKKTTNPNLLKPMNGFISITEYEH